MRPEERLEVLEAALLRLREDADSAILVVEGRNDVAALERLGIGGEVVTVHHGDALQNVVDAVAEHAEVTDRPVILLLDWDRTGGRLFRTFWDGLRGRVPLDAEHRRRLSAAAHTKCIEDLPAELAALRSHAGSTSGL